MADVSREVIAIINKQLREQRSEIRMDERLQDLGVESLKVIDMIFELEEKFNIEIPFNANDPALGSFETVGDVVHMIEGLVARKK